MKPGVLSDFNVRGAPRLRPVRARRAQARGFTLIELLVAVAILAVVAVLSWRGLDQVMRGREHVEAAMGDERVFALMFDQMRIDARLAATDDEVGAPPVQVHGDTLQIVRELDVPGAAPRLQVVRYRISEGRVVRYASPPIGRLDVLRTMLDSHGVDGWSGVALMRGVGSITARLYVPPNGWTMSTDDARHALAENEKALKAPVTGNEPPARSVTGLEVSIGATSLKKPIQRVFLVGE